MRGVGAGGFRPGLFKGLEYVCMVSNPASKTKSSYCRSPTAQHRKGTKKNKMPVIKSSRVYLIEIR